MDELKLENEIKPDNSDRYHPRYRKSATIIKVQVSKQHVFIGIGIFTLLFLVIGISLAIKFPLQIDSHRQSAYSNDLPNVNNSDSTSKPDTNLSSLNATRSNEQHYVKLPENMAETIFQKEKQNNNVSALMNDQVPISTLATTETALTPGTSNSKNNKSISTLPLQSITRHEPKLEEMIPHSECQTNSMLKAPHSANKSSCSLRAGNSAITIQSAPTGYYTLQLSSASQADTLNAYARQQQLKHYWVYKTSRNGNPWYVLVNGVYPSLSQAKNAVTQLPIDMQEKKPWARQIEQVKKDQNN